MFFSIHLLSDSKGEFLSTFVGFWFFFGGGVFILSWIVRQHPAACLSAAALERVFSVTSSANVLIVKERMVFSLCVL